MENASKALLIAGSILIVIMLIALGMKIFNSASGTTDQVETVMSSTEIAMFNSKFQMYAGDNMSYSQVATLNSVVLSNNNSNADKQVVIKYGNSNLDMSNLNISNKYKVTFGYANNGRINLITISQNS